MSKKASRKQNEHLHSFSIPCNLLLELNRQIFKQSF